MKVTAVLGSYNRKFFLKKTIQSIRESKTSFPFEIIVVDGGSTDGSIEWLTKQKDILTIVQHNRGVWQGKKIERQNAGYYLNLAFKSGRGEYILGLSDDCLLQPDAIENGVNHAEKLIASGRNVGAVPFYWRNWPEDERYLVGTILGGNYNINHGLYRKTALEKVGFLEEKAYFFYYLDGDISLKIANAKFEVVPCPTSLVEHYNHANEGLRNSNSERERHDFQNYISRWKGIFYFDGDAYGGTEYLEKTSPLVPNLAERSWGNQYRVHWLKNTFFRLPTILRNRARRYLGLSKPVS